MEKWQKYHLIKNFDKLVEETTCNELLFSYLLSQEVLARVDVERIKRINDRHEQAAALYKFVQTRTNGYVAMARALSRNKQTGPCAVFMEGFAQHAFPDLKVNFLGKIVHLQVIFQANGKGRDLNEMKRYLKLEQFLSLYDKTENARDPLKLLRDTIPQPISCYVPRSLSKRVSINPEVYKVKCSDVFVFKEIGWYELQKLVEPDRVASSTTQLLSLTTRFIILDQIEDWEEICKTAQVPVHLINYETEIRHRHILEATTGGSSVINQFLEHQRMSQGQNKNMSCSEEEFFAEVSQDGASRVCICDLPGMGKSLLLANLARRMNQEHPDRAVVFIQLSHFLGFVMSQRGKQTPFVPDKTLTKKILVEYVTPSPLEYFLFTGLLEKRKPRLELFFDGFDEIQSVHVKVAKQLLASASRLPNTRIFVTSRPNMRHELEATLHVISYDILPFSHANQIDFLTAFWISLKPTSSEKKLREFAEFCVKKLKKSLNEKEESITGIPLQCRLVAEAFSQNALIFAHPKRNACAEKLCTIESSLPDLYRRYFDLRLSKLISSRNQTVSTKLVFSGAAQQATKLMEAVVGWKTCLSKIHQVKNFHMCQALKIFLDNNEMFSRTSEGATTTPQLSSALSVGILQLQFTEVGQESFQFMHRTFAEYLAAEFFGNLLFGEMAEKDTRPILFQFLFQEMMKTVYKKNNIKQFYSFVHPVVLYFLNSVCANKTIISTDDALINAFSSSVSGDNLYHLLRAIISGNHVHLLILLKQLLSKMSLDRLQNYKTSIIITTADGPHSVSQLLHDAAHFGSVPVVEQLFWLLRECFQVDLDGREKEILVGMDLKNLLDITIERHYEMAQFFALRIPMEAADMIDYFVLPHWYVPVPSERKVRIFSIVLDRNECLAYHDPLVLVNATTPAPLDIIKLVLQKAEVDPRAAYKMKTLLHRAAKDMSGKEFSDFCQFLIKDFGAIDLFEEVEGKWTCPLPEILANEDISHHTILKIYDLPWLNVNSSESEYGDKTWPTHRRISVDLNHLYSALLDSAVKGKRSATSIIKMIEMCADVKYTNCSRYNVLHALGEAQYSPEEYHKIVQLLIIMQMGHLFQVADDKGETPFHVAVRNLELLPKTLDLLMGRLHAHNSGQPVKTFDCYVDSNAVDGEGKSVLHAAVNGKRSLSLMKYLVEMGADWSIKSMYGRNLAHDSAYWGRLDHLKYFVELGCDIHEVDSDGNNTLQHAVGRYSPVLDVIQFLVANGARKENKNNDGKTAYMIAINEGVRNETILELLK